MTAGSAGLLPQFVASVPAVAWLVSARYRHLLAQSDDSQNWVKFALPAVIQVQRFSGMLELSALANERAGPDEEYATRGLDFWCGVKAIGFEYAERKLVLKSP